MSTLPPADTVELGSSARQARDESFAEFYVAEYPRLVALARGLTGSAHAEDVAQEAMLVACRRWREVSVLERPDLWVRRTCANLAVSTFRRRLRDARLVTRLSSRRADVPLPETSAGVWTAVRRLPARQAQCIALRYVYDMSVADVASSLGCSEGTVKQHLSRARSTLARELDALEVDR